MRMGRKLLTFDGLLSEKVVWHSLDARGELLDLIKDNRQVLEDHSTRGVRTLGQKLLCIVALAAREVHKEDGIFVGFVESVEESFSHGVEAWVMPAWTSHEVSYHMIVEMAPEVGTRRHVLEPVHFGVMCCLVDGIVLAGGDHVPPTLYPGMTVEDERVDNGWAIDAHCISQLNAYKGNRRWSLTRSHNHWRLPESPATW